MSNLGFTVRDLYKACVEQIREGNGDKHIVITGDDEGNRLHTLYYLFTTDKENLELCLLEEQDRNHTVDNCVLLG